MLIDVSHLAKTANEQYRGHACAHSGKGSTNVVRTKIDRLASVKTLGKLKLNWKHS